MTELLSRRLERLDDEKFGQRPDLILIDGGLGHVNTIKPLMDRYAAEIPFAGLVKDDRHRTRGLVLTTGKEIELKEVSEPITETPDQRSERLGLLRLLTAIQK